MSWQVPLGVEVLVKKAAVDSAFRSLLLDRRAEAAAEIELELQPAEAAMLAAVPAAQLEAIIDRTTVPHEHRRAFLGKAAAAMLAALGAMTTASAAAGVPGGVGGVRADLPVQPPVAPPEPAGSSEAKVGELIAKALGRDPAQVRRETRLAGDPSITAEQRAAIEQALEEAFGIALSSKTLATLPTVGDVAEQVDATLEAQPAVRAALALRLRVGEDRVTPDTSLADDLRAGAADLAAVREELSKRLRIYLAADPFRRQSTVGDLVDLVATALRRRRQAEANGPSQNPTRGIQPDVPPPITKGIRPDLPPDRLPALGGSRPDAPGSFGVRP